MFGLSAAVRVYLAKERRGLYRKCPRETFFIPTRRRGHFRYNLVVRNRGWATDYGDSIAGLTFGRNASAGKPRFTVNGMCW